MTINHRLNLLGYIQLAGNDERFAQSSIERLPGCGPLRRTVLMIAIGGWFEFYELFMPAGTSPGLIQDGIYRLKADGLFDLGSFPCFLASFFLGMFISTLLFTRLSDMLGRRFIVIWAMVAYSICNVLIACSSSCTRLPTPR